MTATTVVLWRHGESDFNLAGRVQGQLDSQLTERGVRQARDAAENLLRLRPRRIISSDLSRARQTAEALAGLTGLTVHADPRLRERGLGEWEGQYYDTVLKRWPTAKSLMLEAAPSDRDPDGIEPAPAVAQRFSQALTDALETMADGGLLVAASHGLAIQFVVQSLVGTADRYSALKNAHWSVIKRQSWAAPWELESHNVAAMPEPS